MSNASERTRNRRLIAASALMLLLAAGTFRFLSSRQQQAIQAGQPRVRQSAAPDLTPQQKAQGVARARELRERWRPWALKHRAELTRMMNAAPGDQAALAPVWDAVPLAPNEPGFKMTDLVPDGVEPPTPVGFGWVGLNKIPMNGKTLGKLTSKVAKVVTMGHDVRLVEMQQTFNKQRDFTIAVSLTPRTETQLWVSGRVTQTGRLPPDRKFEMIAKAKTEGRPFTMSDMQTPYRQFEPPYDFLPSTTLKD